MSTFKSKKCNGENNWEKSLLTLILAYNATKHFSTLCSPSRVFLGRELNLPHLSFLLKIKPEEELDFIIDLMRNSDAIRIRRQFQSYTTPSEKIQPGD